LSGKAYDEDSSVVVAEGQHGRWRKRLLRTAKGSFWRVFENTWTRAIGVKALRDAQAMELFSVLPWQAMPLGELWPGAALEEA
jgi:hypothetical protein